LKAKLKLYRIIDLITIVFSGQVIKERREGKMKIRTYKTEDARAIWELFRDTIRSVNRKDYTEVQCETWANSFSSIEVLKSRLENSYSIVALLDERLVGFGTLNDANEVDLLYSHRDFQRKGIGSEILDQLETYANSRGYEELTAEASMTALGFFQSKGYLLEKKQCKHVNGVEFINFLVKKSLK
jgi:putative acetyltransferase